MHGLVLGGGSLVSMLRQVGQKRLDRECGGEEVFTRPPAVEPGALYDLLHRGSLGVNGGVVQTEPMSHVIEEFGFLISRRGRHIIPPCWCPEIADDRYQAKIGENSSNIILLG